MWLSPSARQAFVPRDGDAIEVHGSINIYEGWRAVPALRAIQMRPLGEGALYQEFMRLKARREGRRSVYWNANGRSHAGRGRFGIVTSATGAALRDILNTLRRRYPAPQIILGATARSRGMKRPPGIVAALEKLSYCLPHPGVILVACGGGSIEDLWAFNDERVACAILRF